ncbi:MbcA/ParS/Xre antitoxin family protein [Chroococcidiopsis sp. CCNUC1]|uniref:MbcA/ParS/Xre antitoxin family protein n=1 Tax=Chroococcidiopsis sp. CCNUC1 TaxID=2653189 RepID=UPI002020D413|nr:MbcA/ParS/Xre antitoxin family protein [Chroococcidiopsis sp. CCNUC1]URD53615.1 MbcA/ParS/Xre antitoxin family protein [Chroococcidiopsis sp. CCNUC1]
MNRLLEHTILAAHDPATGRFDASRLAKALNLTTKEMADILHRTPRGLLKNPDSQQLQSEMARIVRTIVQLRELLDGSMEYVRIWLRSPHPDLGGRTPLSYLVEGKPEVVEALIYAYEVGQPG